ncbi:RNA polymerase sigma-70 factor, sigma-E family [Lentzea fradiae]|uniref:RNA polymerase sigma-70 factor, sigma-E family n=1 Tax=Lentzea fradiae TaxID=200378 RepID=A0A1G7SF99_9PSEU|nr:SigE family RNA polymerase sigma factor [Lentzea fradiae]SDG21688.1 RNA polymerase sigma-70 factor, sigma-E family [Lentzea fradiae]
MNARGKRTQDEREDRFAAYFAARSGAMRATAYLLCGDWHRAEDLVQTTFVKLYVVWHRVGEEERLDAYTRQILVRTFLDETRRGFFRRERPVADFADRPLPAPGDHVEDRMLLVQALAAVAPRQRAALVLRVWADLSVEETAKAMGCGTGNVKSQLARGLAAMRALAPSVNA